MCKHLKYIQQLSTLDLNSNKDISDEGIEMLCNNLKYISKLQYLDLSRILYLFKYRMRNERHWI